MENNGPSDEEIRSAILVLADSGQILGKCPGCHIPLHYNEIIDSVCEKCGQIDFEEIVFVKNSNQLS